MVGKHCEAGDIVVKDEFLPGDVAPGDLVAVPGTGAYCRSMASNYNHALRPPVVAVADGAARVVVRRETEDDLLALDVDPTADPSQMATGGCASRRRWRPGECRLIAICAVCAGRGCRVAICAGSASGIVGGEGRLDARMSGS